MALFAWCPVPQPRPFGDLEVVSGVPVAQRRRIRWKPRAAPRRTPGSCPAARAGRRCGAAGSCRAATASDRVGRRPRPRPPRRLRRRRRRPAARTASARLRRAARGSTRWSPRRVACRGSASRPPMNRSKPLPQPAQDLGRRQQPCARGRQLDGQRQLLEAPAQLADGIGRLHAGAVAEQRHAIAFRTGAPAGNSRSPWMRSSSRLVTSRLRSCASARISESAGAAAITCSKLSSSSSVRRPAAHRSRSAAPTARRCW